MVEKDSYNLITVFILGLVVAMVNKLYIITQNPDQIDRKDDGKINWWWCTFTFVVGVAIGGLVAAFIGVFIAQYFPSFGDQEKYAIAGASAIIADKLWDMAKDVLGRKADSIGDTL